jgi:hypothetical protein
VNARSRLRLMAPRHSRDDPPGYPTIPLLSIEEKDDAMTVTKKIATQRPAIASGVRRCTEFRPSTRNTVSPRESGRIGSKGCGFWRIIATSVFSVLAIVSAPAAHADTDAQFLKALEANGVEPDPGTRADAVGLAHWVCDQMNQGVGADTVMGWLNKGRKGGSSDSTIDSTFVRVAAQYYCPAHLQDASQ